MMRDSPRADLRVGGGGRCSGERAQRCHGWVAVGAFAPASRGTGRGKRPQGGFGGVHEDLAE
jgi:hypothetical protein